MFKIVRNMLLPSKPRLVSRDSGHETTGEPRRSGSWDPRDIERMVDYVKKNGVQGDFAEIGVYRGEAFQCLVHQAREVGRLAHAFDSFCGMAEPTVFDGANYPKGKFDVGGVEEFKKLMLERGVAASFYQTWPGFIPQCFSHVPATLNFALVILDVDHYQPTVEALHWVWPRLSVGGLLALDDFIPSQAGLATRAIKEFIRQRNDFDIVDIYNNQLILAKILTESP